MLRLKLRITYEAFETVVTRSNILLRGIIWFILKLMQPANWLCLDKSKNTLQLKRTKGLVLYFCTVYSLQQNELITNHSKHRIQILYWTICNLSQSSKSVHTVTDTVESAKVGRGTRTTRTRNQMVERVVESRRVKVNLVAHAHSPYLLQKLARSSTWSRTVNAGKRQQFNITKEHSWTLRVNSICILLIQFFSNIPLSIDMNLLLTHLVYGANS